jgi:hypothetical protein
MKFDFLQRLSAFFNCFLIFLNGFPIFLNGFPLSKKFEKIYLWRTKDHHSSFVFPATCSPSFVIATRSPSFVIATRSPSFAIATMPTSHPTEGN